MKVYKDHLDKIQFEQPTATLFGDFLLELIFIEIEQNKN
jgi:hypothetical protein